MARPSASETAWRHIRSVPFYRGILRAIEDSFYQRIEIPGPVLDLGCGDGRFAAAAFRSPLQAGIDPDWRALKEARRTQAYQHLICCDGGHIPFPSGYFGSAISNSTLEHIPHVEAVLSELARVIRPGGKLVFTVPNRRFEQELLGVSVFRRLGLARAAGDYARFFSHVSRHIHLDTPETWVRRVEMAGFSVVDCWNYFPSQALHWMEIGHLGGPWSFLVKIVTGRWVLFGNGFDLGISLLITHHYLSKPLTPNGTCTFIYARRAEG